MKLTPDKVAATLRLFSAQLELFRAQLQGLQSFEQDCNVALAVQESFRRLRDVEAVVQELQNEYPLQGQTLSSSRRRLKLIFTHKDVSERIQNAKNSITEMSNDIIRWVISSCHSPLTSIHACSDEVIIGHVPSRAFTYYDNTFKRHRHLKLLSKNLLSR